jgi:hypothetical protein
MLERERERCADKPFLELASLTSNFPMQPQPRVSALIDIQLFPSPSLSASAPSTKNPWCALTLLERHSFYSFTSVNTAHSSDPLVATVFLVIL